MDSLTDAVATSAVVLGIAVSYFAKLHIDGWIGMLVALFILYTGWTTARDSLSPLLGQAPDAAFVRQIEETVLAHDEVSGVHDLIVHDYGPGRRIISLHAEMPCNADILTMHDAVDVIELELRHKFGCDVTIHMDPVAVDHGEIGALRERVEEMVRGIDPSISIHDFRMVNGVTHTNLIFDVTVPHRFRLSDAQVAQRVREGGGRRSIQNTSRSSASSRRSSEPRALAKWKKRRALRLERPPLFPRSGPFRAPPGPVFHSGCKIRRSPAPFWRTPRPSQARRCPRRSSAGGRPPAGPARCSNSSVRLLPPARAPGFPQFSTFHRAAQGTRKLPAHGCKPEGFVLE